MTQPEYGGLTQAGILQAHERQYHNGETKEAAKVQQTGFRIVGDPAPLFEAFAKAQGQFKPIVRSHTAHVRSDKGNYSYDYAELVDVLNATLPALSANGLAFFQPMFRVGEHWEIRSILAHTSGAYIESSTRFAHGGDWQKLGSAVTYARRYGCSLLGVAPEDDDDGNRADDKPAEQKPRTAPTPPKVERPKPVQQSAPSKPAEPKAPAEERTAPLPGIQADPAQEGLGAKPMPEQPKDSPPVERPPSTPPPAEGAKPSKELMTTFREKIHKYGTEFGVKFNDQPLHKVVPLWCKAVVGVEPKDITLESQILSLMVDLETRKAAVAP